MGGFCSLCLHDSLYVPLPYPYQVSGPIPKPNPNDSTNMADTCVVCGIGLGCLAWRVTNPKLINPISNPDGCHRYCMGCHSYNLAQEPSATGGNGEPAIASKLECLDASKLVDSLEAIINGASDDVLVFDYGGICTQTRVNDIRPTPVPPPTASSGPPSSPSPTASPSSLKYEGAFTLKYCSNVVKNMIIRDGKDLSGKGFGGTILQMHIDSAEVKTNLTRLWNAIPCVVSEILYGQYHKNVRPPSYLRTSLPIFLLSKANADSLEKYADEVIKARNSIYIQFTLDEVRRPPTIHPHLFSSTLPLLLALSGF